MTERQFKTTPQKQADKTTPSVSNTDQHDLVQLQRLLGNQGVQRLLAKGTRIQAKLSVNAPGDKFEAEAEKVSKEVARMPYGVQRAGEEDELQMARANDIQRAGPEEEELQMARANDIQRAGPEEEELQMSRVQRASSETDGGFEVGGEIESTIQAQRGGGEGMGDQTRGFFESGFGADFSNVKVHNDATADQLNQSVSARAFTIGSDIFFRGGEYQPESQAGRELVAHELTHVVQQGGAQVQKDEKKD
jgi:Domain of unknown function (DUF4157)